MIHFEVAMTKEDREIKVELSKETKCFDATFEALQVATKPPEVEHYEGSYDVTPLITSQTLQTNQKFMDDDVRIDMIPTREIENDAGGVTFIVG